MATTSQISAPVFGHPVAFLMTLSDRIAQYFNYRKTVRALSALTPAMLTDLGLNHMTVRQAAHKAVYGV